MALIKNGILEDDPFIFIPDDIQTLPDGRAAIVTLKRWLEDRISLIAHNGQVGVRLASDQSPGQIAEDLKYLTVVAVEFPKFSDGRGFSIGRALRENYHFGGEVRAFGHLIRDQYLFLHRCGFDAIEVSDPDDLPEWQKAMSEISLFYQVGIDGRAPVMSLRRQVAASTD